MQQATRHLPDNMSCWRGSTTTFLIVASTRGCLAGCPAATAQAKRKQQEESDEQLFAALAESELASAEAQAAKHAGQLGPPTTPAGPLNPFFMARKPSTSAAAAAAGTQGAALPAPRRALGPQLPPLHVQQRCSGASGATSADGGAAGHEHVLAALLRARSAGSGMAADRTDAAALACLERRVFAQLSELAARGSELLVGARMLPPGGAACRAARGACGAGGGDGIGAPRGGVCDGKDLLWQLADRLHAEQVSLHGPEAEVRDPRHMVHAALKAGLAHRTPC
eukprot:250502-Chlamydomonas_euryale.AAC.2